MIQLKKVFSVLNEGRQVYFCGVSDLNYDICIYGQNWDILYLLRFGAAAVLQFEGRRGVYRGLAELRPALHPVSDGAAWHEYSDVRGPQALHPSR